MEHRPKTPVAFFIFNRPEQTRAVFEAIRESQPEKLFLIADGPRNEKEKTLCNQTRSIVENINWRCEVKKNYSEKNMGCKDRLSSGLNWVFQEAEQAIILEDDCLPHPSFFPFCEELLERHKHDERIMHISGNFFQQNNRKFHSNNSYYFSVLPHIWGWASWRRAWKHYDVDIKIWPEVRATGQLRKVLADPAVYEYWETIWDQYYRGSVPSWDGQWTFACMLKNGLSINPTINLVSNIGFGPEAMQTTDPNSIFANIPAREMKFPLSHPVKIEPDKNSDAFTWRQNFRINDKLHQKMLGPLRREFPKQYGLIKKLFGKK